MLFRLNTRKSFQEAFTNIDTSTFMLPWYIRHWDWLDTSTLGPRVFFALGSLYIGVKGTTPATNCYRGLGLTISIVEPIEV